MPSGRTPPDAVHRVVIGHVGQVHLAVDDVLQREPAGLDDGLQVQQRLADLTFDRVRETAVTVASALPRDVEEIAGA